MKLSRNWLKRYIDLDVGDDELGEALTLIGLEVEGAEEVEAIRGGLQGVVVGQVLTCEPHPDADKLSVTTVDVGQEQSLQIVCGAPNVAKGQKVLVATVGTMIYLENDSFKIKKSKIRGQVSEGMICAEDELGLGTSHDGIMVLPSETPIGIAAADLYDMKSDIVYDIGLTPNRSDATSQYGIAKDLYAYYSIHGDTELVLKEPNVEQFEITNTQDKIKVEIESPEACKRYSGIVIDNITIGPSPDWMQKLLKSLDVKPVNNVVDITNFILHEIGQPLHAFDVDQINDDTLVVKKLPKGTSFVALDDREFKLSGEDLIISNSKNDGLCIAGVYGGKSSGVTDVTTKIFLESAHFDASHIRRTSMIHNLRTDAAKVFEKGADPNITLFALKKAAQMICDLAGGNVTSEILDLYPKSIEPKEIRVRYSKVKEVIGQAIDVDVIHDILKALKMEMAPVDSDSIIVKVPTDKSDVIREIDVIEEILRIYGFNNVSVPSTVKSALNFSKHPDRNKLKQTISNHLSSIGLNEMMAMSLIGSDLCKKALNIGDESLVYINNTSNVGLDVMRPDMLLSGLLSIEHNINRKQFNLGLYELGRIYFKKDGSYIEKEQLTIFRSGDEQVKAWNQSGDASSFYTIKANVHQVLEKLGVSGYQISELELNEKFIYGLRYHRGPKSIVEFGEVNPKLLKIAGVKAAVYYAEFDLDTLINASAKSAVSAVEISKYPSVKRDLALVLDKHVSYNDVEQLANKTVKNLLKEVTLFDVYESEEHLGKGKKSYAVSFTFESKDKTLGEKEIEKLFNKLIQAYEQRLKAVIRR